MPHFIVLEGPDGAGTTLHSKLLAESLRSRGEKVFLTAEPSSGPIGTFARSELKRESRLSATALQTVFTADRAWHVEAEIIPAIRRGETVICDRYIPSTIVYGRSLNISKELIQNMNNYFIHPDLLFMLLPPYEICKERLSRRSSRDRMENDDVQQKVYDGYARYAKEHPDVIVIDTSGKKEDASRMIIEKIG